MKQRRLGTTGLYVSHLALGTMSWGHDTDEDDASNQLTAFLDAGGNLVDTADVYIDGESERVLGRLLAGVVKRDDLVVATKAASVRGGDRDRDASRRHILGRARRLARPARHRLRRPVADARLGPAYPARGDAGGAGRRGRARDGRATSGSATTPAGRPRRRRPGSAPGRGGRRSWRPRSSTRCSSAGSSARSCPAALNLGIGILPWSPLGRGVLTGKYQTGTPADSRGATADYTRFITPYLDERASRIVGAVLTAADGLGVSPLAVALAWVRDRPGVVAPIVGRAHRRSAEGLARRRRDRAAGRDPPRARRRVDAGHGLSRGRHGRQHLSCCTTPYSRPDGHGVRGVLRGRPVARASGARPASRLAAAHINGAGRRHRRRPRLDRGRLGEARPAAGQDLRGRQAAAGGGRAAVRRQPAGAAGVRRR